MTLQIYITSFSNLNLSKVLILLVLREINNILCCYIIMPVIQKWVEKRIWSKFYMDYFGKKKLQQYKHTKLFSFVNDLPAFLSKQYFISIDCHWFYIFDLEIWQYKFHSEITFLPFVFFPFLSWRLPAGLDLHRVLSIAYAKCFYCNSVQKVFSRATHNIKVLQGQAGCVVPLRASQSAKEQIKGQTVEAQIRVKKIL